MATLIDPVPVGQASKPLASNDDLTYKSLESIMTSSRIQFTKRRICLLALLLVFPVALSGAQTVGSKSDLNSAPKSEPKSEPYPLWDPTVPLPLTKDIHLLEETQFHVIKHRRPKADGYNWLHGVALAAHGGRLYSSFGHNTGKENTAGEVANGRSSLDWGRQWSELFEIDRGQADGLAVSHGVFLSRKPELWAFQGAFYGKMQSVHTRAYLLDLDSNNWMPRKIEIEDGFWPMQEPQQLENGTWAMAGLLVIGGVGKDNNPPSIALRVCLKNQKTPAIRPIC